MKREGRQHGVVRTYRILSDPLNPRPESKFVNKLDSPPTAGLFSKVSSKPTNHSKFTGKCGRARCVGCHIHPASKSKDKAKGTQKLRSGDVVSNHRLLTWRVVDGRPGLNFSGFSATGIVDHLDYSNYLLDDEYDDDYLSDDDSICGGENYDDRNYNYEISRGVEDDDEKLGQIGDDLEESYCDVGFVVNQVIEIEGDNEDDHEGWCVVAQIL